MFLSHHIIEEGLCENHFKAVVIPDPTLFLRHHTVLYCLFNHSETELKRVAKIKISFNQQYIPLLLHIDVTINFLQYNIWSFVPPCERIPLL